MRTGPRVPATLGHAGEMHCPVAGVGLAGHPWGASAMSGRDILGMDACLPGSLPIHCSVEPGCRALQTETLNVGLGSEGASFVQDSSP